MHTNSYSQCVWTTVELFWYYLNLGQGIPLVQKNPYFSSSADGFWLWFGLNNNNLSQFITDVCFAEVRSWKQNQHCFQLSVISLTQHNERNATVLTKPVAHESTRSRKNPQEMCHIQGRSTQHSWSRRIAWRQCYLLSLKVTELQYWSIQFHSLC